MAVREAATRRCANAGSITSGHELPAALVEARIANGLAQCVKKLSGIPASALDSSSLPVWGDVSSATRRCTASGPPSRALKTSTTSEASTPRRDTAYQVKSITAIFNGSVVRYRAANEQPAKATAILSATVTHPCSTWEGTRVCGGQLPYMSLPR